MAILDKVNFSSGFRKILANISYLFGERVFNMVLSLVVGIYVARYLGPRNYGLLSYAQSLVTLFMAFSSLGATNIVIRDLVKQARDRESLILGTTFTLLLGAGLISAILVVIVGFIVNKGSITRWLIIIISANLILQTFQTFDYWFQSKVLSKYSTYARTSGQIVSSILKIIFVLLSMSVIYFAIAIICAGIINGLIWIYNYNKKSSNTLKWSFDSSYAKSLLKDAWPLILSAISIALYMNIDQVMLKSMVDANAVGNYAVAVKISALWYFIPVSIASSVFPAIIKSKKEGDDKYYSRLQYLYDVMAGFAILIALPMTFFSGDLIRLLFGNEFIFAGNVLAVHIWSGVFVFLGVAQSKWLINENYQRYGMIFSVAGAISNIILNFWLIPKIGIMGAAWATLIAYMLSSWIISVFFKKTRISFKMLGLALINAVLVIPVIKSIKNVLKEAKNAN